MKYLLSVMVGLLSMSSAHASWDITRAYFKAESVLDLNNGNSKNMDNSSLLTSNKDAYWSATLNLHNALELNGKIVIEEFNRETITKRRTVINNVFVMMDTYGLNFRMNLVEDTYFPLRGLKGKKISDIFDYTFKGGKFNVGLGFIIGVEPNYSFVANEAGIRIPNIERWLQLNIGANLELGYLTMDFNATGVKSAQTITRTTNGSQDGGKAITQPLSMKKMKDIVIGQ